MEGGNGNGNGNGNGDGLYRPRTGGRFRLWGPPPELPRGSRPSRTTPGAAYHALVEGDVDWNGAFRRTGCRRYDICLAYAAALGWPSWSCQKCRVLDLLEQERADGEARPELLAAQVSR